MTHAHNFPDWPFADSTSAAAFTTRPVLEQGFPVLLVSHDPEGDWQFLCGTTTELEDCKLVCLGCAFQRDPTLAEVADLPLGWMAEREVVGGAWERFLGPEDSE